MLSIHPVSPEMGRHYYKEENYYSQKRAGQTSEWWGRGAVELGLSGAVDGARFQRLLSGLHPTHDDPLRLSAKGAQQRAGLDLTFSAPKSVSLAALIGGDGRLEEAHRIAVRRAMTLAEERYAKTRVGPKGVRSVEATGNLTVASFHHDTSRAKDPQLHTHCVVLNTVKRSDGCWRSMANEDLYRHSKLLGLMYQNELAREVQKLGYGILPQSNGTFEIEGYSEDQIRAFSKRREQIEDLGATSQKEARYLVLKNRPSKGLPIPRGELQLQWIDEAKRLGIRHPKSREFHAKIESSNATQSLTSAIAHCSERDVEFKREDLEKFALESNLGRLSWDHLQRSIRGAETFRQLITVKPGRYTTQDALALEQDIVRRLDAGQKAVSPLCSTVPEAIRTNTLGLTLGQKAALETSLVSADRFMGWQGVAGSGKTFAMNQLREITHREGVTIRGFAPSAEAAKVLGNESGIEADTVASLLHSPTPGRMERGSELWIVDEAGLLSARQCAALMQKADDAGARVIFVGDTRQLSSVEAGNPFKLLQTHGMTTVHLNESRRQKDILLKAAANAMAAGDMGAGLDLLKDQTQEIKSEQKRLKEVARSYVDLDPEARLKSLLLAGTNKARETLTEMVRGDLTKQGSLGREDQVTCLTARDLTREETRTMVKIEPGHVLVFHKEDRASGVKPGEQVVVTHVDRLARLIYGQKSQGQRVILQNQGDPRFTVYEARERAFAIGDQVRWTRNDRTLGLRNGQDLTVVGLSPSDIMVQGQDGSTYRIDKASRPFLDHNYVNTVYSAQGKTCDQVLIATDHLYGKEAMYVAVTRARERVTLFTPERDAMIRQAEITRAKRSATDLLARDKPFFGAEPLQNTRRQSSTRHGLGRRRMG